MSVALFFFSFKKVMNTSRDTALIGRLVGWLASWVAGWLSAPFTLVFACITCPPTLLLAWIQQLDSDFGFWSSDEDVVERRER